jgi:hypothetical protein
MAAMAQPAYGKEGVLIPSLKAILEVGTFVVYKHRVRNDEQEERIARIIDTIYDNEGKKKMKLHVYDILGLYVNVQCYASQILDVAFLSDDPGSIAGRKNVVHFRNDQTDGKRFPCDSPDCPIEVSYSRCIWNDLERMRALVRRMLTSSTMQQGQFARKREYTYINRQTFSFVKRMLADHEGVEHSPAGATYKRVVFDITAGLTAVSKREAFACEFLVFRNNNGVDALTSLLGTLTVLGMRRKRPRVDAGPSPLRTNDIVHYLVEEEAVVSARLVYAKEVGRLTVELGYSPYVVSFNNAGHPMNCNNARVSNAITRNNLPEDTHHSSTSNALIGMQFELPDNEDDTFVVVSIDATDVSFCFCAKVEQGGAEVRLQRVIVEQLVNHYLE